MRSEDGSAQIKTIGSTRSPFAVIAGGHASNPGFSSTPGVLISLVRLKTFAPAADHSSVILGTGNVSQFIRRHEPDNKQPSVSLGVGQRCVP